jgi:hypothetical protein
MSKNDALKFIANLMSEEEAVGEVTSLKSSRSSRKRKSIEEGEEAATAQTTLPTSEEGGAASAQTAIA